MPHQHALEAGHACYAIVIRHHVVEHDAGFGRGCERVMRIELHRSQQPRAQRGLQRFEIASAPRHAGRVDEIHELRGVLVVSQRAPEDERQRDRADLHEVDTMIESRKTGRARHGDAQALPVVLMRVPELFEPGTQRVIRNDHPRARVDDDAFGAEGAVRDIAIVRMQRLDAPKELAQQAQRGAEIERNPGLDRVRQQPRQPDPVRRIRHDAERRRVETFGAAYGGE